MPAATIRERYPRWNDFVGLLGAIDPSSTFRNAYVDALTI